MAHTLSLIARDKLYLVLIQRSRRERGQPLGAKLEVRPGAVENVAERVFKKGKGAQPQEALRPDSDDIIKRSLYYSRCQ